MSEQASQLPLVACCTEAHAWSSSLSYGRVVSEVCLSAAAEVTVRFLKFLHASNVAVCVLLEESWATVDAFVGAACKVRKSPPLLSSLLGLATQVAAAALFSVGSSQVSCKSLHGSALVLVVSLLNESQV